MNTLIQLGRLFKAVETIEGRKRLQKMVHILQEFGVPFGLQFSYHYYGPYSEDLQSSIQFYQNNSLINEVPVDKGPFPTSHFQAGQNLFDLLAEVEANEAPVWGDFANELNLKSPKELETISTLIYLGALKQPTKGLKEKFVALKPHLESLYDAAVRNLETYQSRYAHLSAA